MGMRTIGLQRSRSGDIDVLDEEDRAGLGKSLVLLFICEGGLITLLKLLKAWCMHSSSDI